MFKIENPTRSGRFIKRLNRFVAEVEIDGEKTLAHVPNSGRMRELLFEGNIIIVEEQFKKERKTDYDLIMAEYEGFLVSIDSRLPNYLVEETINQGQLPGFEGIKVEKREATYGSSRLDLKLNGDEEGYCEIKSVTLARDGVAMFPDAPTKRGARHLEELIKAYREGYRANVIFLIQRDDATSFTPNDETDPHFGQTLRKAIDVGVVPKAYTCQVSKDGVKIIKEIPVAV